MDLSKFHNPYDFANPVSDEDLFVGRKNELDEIYYYLNHAKTAPRPINIVLLGTRASGKTSLLNICEINAKKRGFCTVRIDLDEDDAKTQLGFFYKIFDGIFSSVCESGKYMGKQGKTYDTYLDIVNAYKIPEDKEWCPFIFPLQYAKAMSSGNINASLSDNNYKNDLIKLRSEINCPIVLLFDECNVLAHSRVHLEKIRNIFMNTPGYMLIFTGTPDLFPVMDDVFSPIIRQFKKINVNAFEENKETEECIRKPLEKIGIKPEEIFDFRTYREVNEIHDLSGGSPYEIQLICHILFRKIQEKRARKMKLNLSVLEDIREELETSQDVTTRPILKKIQNLKKNQLSALNLLCACDGYALFEQIWTIEYIFNGEKRWTKDTLNKELQYLINEGILKSEDNIIKFIGDDFDKIYTKYFAREQKIPLSFPKFPLEVFCRIRLNHFFAHIKGASKILPGFIGLDVNMDISKIYTNMISKSTDDDIFVEMPSIIKKLYLLVIKYRDKKAIPIVDITLIFPWLNFHSLYYAENPNDTSLINGYLDKVESIKERVDEVGGDLIVKKKELPITTIEEIVQKIEKTANEKLRNSLVFSHHFEMIIEYMDKLNKEEALFHANLSYRYNSNLEPFMYNNIGYVFMSVGDCDKARRILEKSIKNYQESCKSALPNYNLGILEAKCGNLNEALAKINFCINELRNVDKKERGCDCLFIPMIENGELKYKEVIEQLDILEIAVEAKNNLEKFLNNEV